MKQKRKKQKEFLKIGLKYILVGGIYALAFMLLRETFLRELIAFFLIAIGVFIQNERR